MTLGTLKQWLERAKELGYKDDANVCIKDEITGDYNVLDHRSLRIEPDICWNPNTKRYELSEDAKWAAAAREWFRRQTR